MRARDTDESYPPVDLPLTYCMDVYLSLGEGHHPLRGTTRRSNGTMLQIENGAALAAAFSSLRRKTGFYFCGHNHNHSIYQQDPWCYVQTADPLDCKSFRLVSLADHQVDIQTLDFDFSDSQLQQDFEITRSRIPSGFTPQDWTVANGEAADRTLTVQYPAMAQL